MRESMIQVELNSEEMDYIATVMLYWRIVAKVGMGIKLSKADEVLMKQSFDELCVFEANMVGNDLAQKLLRVNVAAQEKLAEKYL